VWDHREEQTAGVDTQTVSREGSPHATVVEIEAEKASKINKFQQASTSSPQRIQPKAVGIRRKQQISITGGIWFGTRGSEVQILSPRPMFSSTYTAFLDFHLSVEGVFEAEGSG